jgi:hypothetical protein
LASLAADPALIVWVHGCRIEALDADAAVHLGEAGRVPQLGAEIAITFNALCRQFDVARLARHGMVRVKRTASQP